jgi:chromosome segregation ATPase
MLTRKQLEEIGLQKENIDRILDAHDADVGELKGQLAAAKTETEAAKATLTERNTQLETLKTTAGDADALKAQIAQLQADNAAKEAEHAAQVQQLKISAAVDTALTAAKAKNTKAVKALLDIEKAELDEKGSVKGLKEQLAALAKSDGYLFDTTAAKPAIKGAIPAQVGVDAPPGNIDPAKMTYDQFAAAIASGD